MGISVLTSEKEFSVSVARASGQIWGTGKAGKMNQNKLRNRVEIREL